MALLEALVIRLRSLPVGAVAGAADDEFCRRVICGAFDGSLAAIFRLRELPELVWGRAPPPRRSILSHLAAQARNETPLVVVQAAGAIWATPEVDWYPEVVPIPGIIILVTELLSSGGMLFFLDEHVGVGDGGEADQGGDRRRSGGGLRLPQMAKNPILRDAVSLVGAVKDKDADAFARDSGPLRAIPAGSRQARLAARLMMLRGVYPLGPMVLLAADEEKVAEVIGVLSKTTVTSQTPFVGLVVGSAPAREGGVPVKKSAPALAKLAMESGILGEPAVNRVRDTAISNIEALIRTKKSGRERLLQRKAEIEQSL